MKLFGIDFSIDSPSVVFFNLDEDLNIIEHDFIGFTTAEKHAKLCHNLVLYSHESFSNDIEKYTLLNDHVMNYIESKIDNDVEVYIGLEGYSYGSKGKVFQIGEATGILKYKLFHRGFKIRIYSPKAIKNFAGDGTAKKPMMDDFYIRNDVKFPQIDKLIRGKSPKADVIDALFIAKFLQMELKIRKDVALLETFDKHRKKIFKVLKRVDDKNLIDRPFLVKKDTNEK